VVWPAITFKPAPVRAPVFSSTATRTAVPDTSAPDQADTDDWSDAQSAFAVAPPAEEDAGPPLAQLESQMRAEVAGRDPRPAKSSPPRTDDEADNATTALPDLDALVGRLPADVRETLEELFRVRFQAVRRIPRKALVNATGKPPVQ
jgi:hypothetical protein